MNSKIEIEFLSPAETEFVETVKYYNSESTGLGFEFALEIEKTIERIIQYPEAWPKISERARKCRCNKFPYGVVYFYDNNPLVIVAIMHLAKEPNYWKDRI